MARDPYRRQARHVRRALRHGRRDQLQLVIVGPEQPSGWLILAALGRLAYRHRSAFAPFAIALAAFGTAASAHPHHARCWVLTALMTALAAVVLGIPHRMLRRNKAGEVTAGALARLWAACGIDRAAERGYAAVVIAVTGGWLSAAIAAGPGTRPLPVLAGIATVTLGIPWWYHRRRRARVRVERIIAGWPGIAAEVGLPGSRIGSVVVDAWGWTARVILRRGTTARHAAAKIPEIESGLGLRPGSIRVLPDGTRADRMIMRVVENEPLAQDIPWPGRWVTSVASPVEIGISEDGRPVRVLLLRRNALVGGIMGSGKSGILNVIIANLAACRDVVLWGVDMKGGMELQPWACCFERLAFTPEQAAGLFRDAVSRLDQRAARMTAARKRLWEPTPDDPALVVITDEHAELPPQAHSYADSLARRGRAVAVNLIAGTQRPTQAAMGSTAVRSQMDVRICLRVREPRDGDLILGQGAITSGWHPHTLTRPGEFLISDPEHQIPGHNRAYLLTDARRDLHAAQCAPLRPRFTPGPVYMPPPAARPAPSGGKSPAGHPGRAAPETALWAALRTAGPEGVTVADLMTASGMGRSWVYCRLREHARAGRAIQAVRGAWRAVTPPITAAGREASDTR